MNLLVDILYIDTQNCIIVSWCVHYLIELVGRSNQSELHTSECMRYKSIHNTRDIQCTNRPLLKYIAVKIITELDHFATHYNSEGLEST